MTQAAIQPAEPIKAAMYVVSAMALIGLVDNLVVRIAAEIGLWQFHAMRSLMALPIILCIGWITGWQMRPNNLRAVLVRGTLLSLSMICYFGALAFLSVAEAVAGVFTAPVLVVVITALWYRQTVRAEIYAAVILGFTGSLLVLQPDFTGLGLVSLLPIAGGFFYALSALTTRRSCSGEGALSMLAAFLFMMFVFGCVGLAITTSLGGIAPSGPEGFLQRGWETPSIAVLVLTVLQAVTAVVGVGLITRGYILADASQVAVFEYSLLIFAAIWGWILWTDQLDTFGILGMVLIFLSGALLLRLDRRGVPA